MSCCPWTICASRFLSAFSAWMRVFAKSLFLRCSVCWAFWRWSIEVLALSLSACTPAISCCSYFIPPRVSPVILLSSRISASISLMSPSMLLFSFSYFRILSLSPFPCNSSPARYFSNSMILFLVFSISDSRFLRDCSRVALSAFSPANCESNLFFSCTISSKSSRILFVSFFSLSISIFFSSSWFFSVVPFTSKSSNSRFLSLRSPRNASVSAFNCEIVLSATSCFDLKSPSIRDFSSSSILYLLSSSSSCPCSITQSSSFFLNKYSSSLSSAMMISF